MKKSLSLSYFGVVDQPVFGFFGVKYAEKGAENTLLGILRPHIKSLKSTLFGVVVIV